MSEIRTAPLVVNTHDDQHVQRQIITPALAPSRYDNESGKWDALLVITRPARNGKYQHRFMVGYVDPSGSCRRAYQGPILPGPYAYAYGLACAIAADPRMCTGYQIAQNKATQMEWEVADGDIIRLGWELFEVKYDRDQWIQLHHIDTQP